MSRDIQDIGGNAIIYSYPNGDFDIVCAAEKIFKPAGWESSEDWSSPRPDGAGAGECGAARPAGDQMEFPLDNSALPAPRQKGKKSEGEDRLRSMRRARAKLRRLALANEFEWFVTLTLDKDRIDRYDPRAIMQKVNRWLDNMVRRHGLRYVLVPEQHKDGAYHFHGFFAGDVEAVESGHYDSSGHMFYNLPQWEYGYTTALRLYGTYSQAVAYVCKYIGKQDGERPMGRWYYSGGGLKEPPKLYATLDYRELGEQYQGEAVEFAIPGTQMMVVHHRTSGDGEAAPKDF